MGKFNTAGADQAAQVEAATFTATGQSTPIALYGDFSVAVWGTFSATVVLEKSFDGGTTWIPAANAAGSAISLTAALAIQGRESEMGILYRLDCTWTSGTVNYRVSASVPRTTNTTI